MDLDRTTRRYFQLLEALDQAVIVTDAEGVIAQWSPAATKLYGWSADEVIGKNVLEVTPIEMSRAEGAEILRTLARGELWSGEFAVRTRRGRAATASVTDIPLLDAAGTVAGVIGVSAVSKTPTKLRPLLRRFAAACEKVWPGQFRFQVELASSERMPGAEPHIIQLLTILVLLNAEALERGQAFEVTAGPAEKSPFAEFGLASTRSALYLRIRRRDQEQTYSVLRSLPFSAEPTRYASGLVRMIGGMLISGTAPDGADAIHLFLPLAAPL